MKDIQIQISAPWGKYGGGGYKGGGGYGGYGGGKGYGGGGGKGYGGGGGYKKVRPTSYTTSRLVRN